MQSEQPQVRVGQVWKDCDKRMGERYLKVMRIIKPANDIAVCLLCSANGETLDGYMATRISIRRMKPGATGYRMVRDAK